MKPIRKHTSSNPSVHEAMRLLEEHGYDVYRIVARNDRQVSIIATKGREELIIAIFYSRKPVPDAKTLRGLFPEKVEQLRIFAKTERYKTMIWVISPLIGWRYYRVDVGGISYDWDFAKMMVK